MHIKTIFNIIFQYSVFCGINYIKQLCIPYTQERYFQNKQITINTNFVVLMQIFSNFNVMNNGVNYFIFDILLSAN